MTDLLNMLCLRQCKIGTNTKYEKYWGSVYPRRRRRCKNLLYGTIWDHLHNDGADAGGVGAVGGVRRHYLSMGLIPIGRRRRAMPCRVV